MDAKPKQWHRGRRPALVPGGGRSLAYRGGVPLMVVKATHAEDDPERAHMACNVASVALASRLATSDGATALVY